MITINLTEKEANYLVALLKNDTAKSQSVMKKEPALKGFFSENNSLNGTICRKITNSRKKSNEAECN
ncbi:hypothetical protein [Enterococcus sp. AZ072]|uniref:hypothetical protein n=1 Tax=unclassified Enterococcus TaxID=2608891 RepID=UPI003D2D1046